MTRDQAEFAAGYFKEYFNSFDQIEDYMRKTKMERIDAMPAKLPFFSYEDEFFVEFDMNPNDMDIEVRVADKRFWDLLEVVSSHIHQSMTPGRQFILMVFEKNTSKIIGFIKFVSPVINLKPRSNWLGAPLNTRDIEVMQRFNNASCMGSIIIPAQPFGFNYLGGKLLAAICCSHLSKNLNDKKYGINICHFETTSLYGNSKSVSQYDGMKPYIRYKGLTESDFTPHLSDKTYSYIKSWFMNETSVDISTKSTNEKLSITQNMISRIMRSLKHYDTEEYEKFVKVIQHAKTIVEKKRVYMGDYGFENSREYILGLTDKLVKKSNYDSYSFDNMIKWWKKKATKRYESLKKDGRLRTELEIWRKDANIDIIR